MQVTAIIPARYASTRFPAKPLVKIGGVAMIQRVYERVQACSKIDDVIIATDDDRIFDFARSFGAKVMMTDTNHLSGTDRVAEVAAQLPDTDIVLNVQGDEPFIAQRQLEQLVDLFAKQEVQIATLARPIAAVEDLSNPNVVKLVKASDGRALYFSRSPIPYIRDLAMDQWLTKGLHFQHIGLYAYRKEVLLELAKLQAAVLEQAESLEQLRWLAADYVIYTDVSTEPSIGIDTPEDLIAAEAWLQNQV